MEDPGQTPKPRRGRGLRLGPSEDSWYPLPPSRYLPIEADEVKAILARHGDIDLDRLSMLADHYSCQVYNHDHAAAATMLADELHHRLVQLSFLVKTVAILVGEHTERSSSTCTSV